MKYSLRPETIIDIIQTVPDDRVDTLMKELSAMIHHAKLSYELARVLDPTATVKTSNFVWDDDGKGDVTVNHFLNGRKIFKTKEKV